MRDIGGFYSLSLMERWVMYMLMELKVSKKPMTVREIEVSLGYGDIRSNQGIRKILNDFIKKGLLVKKGVKQWTIPYPTYTINIKKFYDYFENSVDYRIFFNYTLGGKIAGKYDLPKLGEVRLKRTNNGA